MEEEAKKQITKEQQAEMDEAFKEEIAQKKQQQISPRNRAERRKAAKTKKIGKFKI